MPDFSEATVEQSALSWFGRLGYAVVEGSAVAPGETGAERANFGEVTLANRLLASMRRLNPDVPDELIDDTYRKVRQAHYAAGGDPIARNQAFHAMLMNGVTVEQKRADGSIGGRIVRIIDFETPGNNDWLVVSQFTVVEAANGLGVTAANQEGGAHHRRPDIVVFVNGLPLAVLELKNAADEQATSWDAFRQMQTYKQQIPSLFTFNEALVISDGLEARIGTLTSDRERFMPWRTIEGETLAAATRSQLEVLIEGVFEKSRFLQIIRHFIVFEDEGNGGMSKKMAGYHQFHAVNKALAETVRASSPGGDRRVGVVWHTQGSGKSLTMAFYAGRAIVEPSMGNPTLIVITDRNDLDNQLFTTFARCQEVLRQAPVQAEDRDDLRSKLTVAAGGVVFTTIQKFFPDKKGEKHILLSERRNVIVIADEAHRSQYAFAPTFDSRSGSVGSGFAQHLRDALPNASFIGFTGTPIDKADANTRTVFGEYISSYDIQRAVEDKATVPIYYESRLAKLGLKDSERPTLEEQFDEATEGEEVERKEQLKTRWAQLEALVGSEYRIELVARDMVSHVQQRFDTMYQETGNAGKAMIVCMSRRICIELYNAIQRLRPDWHGNEDGEGVVKIVMTGSASDPTDWQPHIRSSAKREELANRFKDPNDAFRIVIVRDMWLTGFDAPCLHTMYLDKPMRGHGLMQAIARVNRVFGDKPGGLVVDYLGLAYELKKALAVYTESGGKGSDLKVNQEDAVSAMLLAHERCREIFDGFDWSPWTYGSPAQRVSLLPAAQEHVIREKAGKNRFLLAAKELSQAFTLAVPHDDAMRIRSDVGFFQAVRAALTKATGERQHSAEDVDMALRQLVSRAVASEEVVSIFDAAGLKKPDISVLSDEFLAEVRGMPYRNLAVELLRKLLTGEIKVRGRKNLVRARSFTEMLERSIRRYQNRVIETSQVIEELIALAKEIRAADTRGRSLGLSEEEAAFYDALKANDSAVQVLGDPTLRQIARELVATVHANTTIDWALKESVSTLR